MYFNTIIIFTYKIIIVRINDYIIKMASNRIIRDIRI